MAATTKKPNLQASDVQVGSRTLEAALLDLAEQSKETQRIAAEARQVSADAQQRATIALETIAAVSKDLQAMTREMREANQRTDARLAALEKTSRSG